MNRRQALQSLALVSLAGALAGCSSGSSNGGGPTTKTSGTQANSGDTVTPDGDGVLAVNASRMTPGPATTAGSDLAGFGVQLLLKNSSIGATANGSISPYSIYAALAMTDAGALGQTEAQLAKVLGGDQQRQAGNVTAIDTAVAKAVSASKSGKTPSVVQAANSLWPDKQLAVRKDYLHALATGYDAQMHVVDYQHDPTGATKDINNWVAEQTHQLIPQLLSPGSVQSSTRLELVNALYLKAAWRTAFGEPSKPQAFMTAAGAQVQVGYMKAAATMAVAQGSNWQSVTIPYVGGGLGMTIVLPTKGAFTQVRSSLASVLPKATAAAKGMARRGQVTVTMPEFSIDTRSQLASTLKSLGVTQLFSPGADLSGIAGKPGELRVDTVTHQSIVKVDRHGTEAAAATAVGITAGAAPSQLPKNIAVDRAFFFAIHDTTTGAPLFLGQIADPTAGH
jgi:serpin B